MIPINHFFDKSFFLIGSDHDNNKNLIKSMLNTDLADIDFMCIYSKPNLDIVTSQIDCSKILNFFGYKFDILVNPMYLPSQDKFDFEYNNDGDIVIVNGIQNPKTYVQFDIKEPIGKMSAVVNLNIDLDVYPDHEIFKKQGYYS